MGVIDSGLDVSHPAFRGRVDLRSVDLREPSGTQLTDPHGHGTHVAGIIGAARQRGPMYGIAPGATLLSVGVGRDDDVDDLVGYYVEDFAQAWRYVANQRLKVANGSYGPPAMPSKWIYEEPEIPDADYWVLLENPDHQVLPHQIMWFNKVTDTDVHLLEYEAIEAAARADVLMVFGAGNDYEEQPLSSLHPTGPGLLPYIRSEHHGSGVYRYISADPQSKFSDFNNPFTYEYLDFDDPRLAKLDFSHLQGKLVVVVATDNEGNIASYSNRCGVAWQWCLAAPGGDGEEIEDGILSTVPGGGYEVGSGTSMAAPLVAGAAAVLRGAFPYLDASQTIELLLTTSNSTGHFSDRAVYGRGMLDLGRAILGPKEFGAEGFAPVFEVDTQGYDSTWSGDIMGRGGLTKRGAGTLSLTGNNSYVGDTIIAGGSLRVDGNIARSAVWVQPDGLLTGSGVVGATQVAGAIAPAAKDGSIAALTIEGDYQQLAGSTLHAQLGANGESSQLRVRGAADLQGGALQVHGITPRALGKQYTVIQSSEGVTGAFDHILNDYLFVGLSAGVQGDRMVLSVDRRDGGFATVAASRNQRAVARAADALDVGHAVFDSLVMSTDPQRARHALDRLSGDLHPSLLGVLAEQSSLARDAMTDRGRLTQTLKGVDVWGRYTGSRTHLGDDGNAGALRNTSHGVIFGGDTDVSSHTRLGVAVGFGSSQADVHSRGARAKLDNYLLGAYGHSNIGPASLRYGATYSGHHIDSRRDVLAGETRSRAQYHAQSTQAFMELATVERLGSSSVEPFAGLAYVDTRAGAFDESGPAGLHGDRSRFRMGFSTVGVRAGSQWTLANQSTLGVEASVAWQHALGDTTPTTSLSWRRDASFTAAGLAVARNSLAMQTGLTWQHDEWASLNVSYQGQFGQRANEHGLSVSARWRF